VSKARSALKIQRDQQPPARANYNAREMRIFLTGATGFVGGHILQRLLADGHDVVAVVRGRSAIRPQNDHLHLASGDVVSGAGLDVMQGCDAVIHLVGIIMEQGDATFERVHHEATRNVVAAARRAGVERLVQMSALGARADGVSGYQTSKWRGEEEVRNSGIPFVILRPSLIFGPGDGFITQMVDVMRSAPLFRPVVGTGQYRFRPVYIDDVVSCFVSSLINERATNQSIDIGGGEELTLEQMLRQIADCVGVSKAAVHMPWPLMYAGAVLMQAVLKKPPVTTDQLRMLREGSTCDITRMREIFGIEPIGFTTGLQRYLCRPR
jgi:NADH dehydrogenase